MNETGLGGRGGQVQDHIYVYRYCIYSIRIVHIYREHIYDLGQGRTGPGLVMPCSAWHYVLP
jgi:hypothetical protein